MAESQAAADPDGIRTPLMHDDIDIAFANNDDMALGANAGAEGSRVILY